MQMHLVCLVVHLVEMYNISRLSPNHSIWGLIWKERFGACFLLSPPLHFLSLYCHYQMKQKYLKNFLNVF